MIERRDSSVRNAEVSAVETFPTRKFHPIVSEAGITAIGPAVALIPGGDVWEDFLDTIGVSLEQFCAEGPGGWMLGYMDALARAGVTTVLILISRSAGDIERFKNPVTGNIIVVIPARSSYTRIRRWLGAHPPHGVLHLATALRRLVRRISKPALPYLSTPSSLLAQELRAHGCRAILCQEYEFFRFNQMVAMGKRLGLPVFATFQGATHDANPWSRLWKSRAIRRSAGLFIAAQTELDRVHRRYGSDVQAWQVFNPVDVDEWQRLEDGSAGADLEIPDGADVVVWHGRIDIYTKGLDIMLGAWRRVRAERSGRKLVLTLLGTGNDANEFARLMSSHADDSVRWFNRYVISRPEIRSFLSAGDIFAFPSRFEGFAVAPIEAMACGLPIVAAAASGVTEALDGGKCGLIVPTEDVNEFAVALGKLIDDCELRRTFTERGLNRVREVFSLNAVGERLAACLRSSGVDI